MGAKKGQRKKAAGLQRFALLVFGGLFVVLFAAFAIAQGVGQPSVPDGDVALVEDVPAEIGHISRASFTRTMAQVAAQGGLKKPPKPGDKKFAALKEQALSELLDAVWLQGEAEELGIEATPKQIATELAQIKKQNFKTAAEFKKFLKESGFNKDDVNLRVKLQILSTQIQQQITSTPVNPSNSEIADYYAAAKATQFTQPATRDVRVITNKDAAKLAAAKAALEKDDSAKSWKKVAKKFSEDSFTKDTGGLQAGVAEASGRFPQELEDQLFSVSALKIIGPLKTSQGTYIFQVVKTTPEKVQSLGDVRSSISSQLTQQRQQQIFSEFIAGYQSKWTSRTFCADDFLIVRCANYVSDGRLPTTPPACYEADPKGGRPADCPAPVVQSQPALPGSVSILSPEGKRMAQRPRPAGLKEGEEAGAGLEGLIPGAAGAPEG